jgi:hypothetical protein
LRGLGGLTPPIQRKTIAFVWAVIYRTSLRIFGIWLPGNPPLRGQPQGVAPTTFEIPFNPKILNNHGFGLGSRPFFYAQNATVAAEAQDFVPLPILHFTSGIAAIADTIFNSKKRCF